jgi:iron complex outermembrane receptor protein
VGQGLSVKFAVTFLFILFSAISFPAAADEKEIEDFSELDLEELLDVVVTAAKHRQSIAESPSAVTVITREDIETLGARTLPEILRLVPNTDIALINPLWYEVGVRGDTSINSDSVLLMVDGRDVTIEFLGFPTWTVHSFNMDEVERIEVIRGPGSALYGANAYAGVVHVITREPGTGPLAQASLRGGEHGSAELALRFSERFGPVAVGIGAGLERADFWTDRDHKSYDVIRGRADVKIGLAEKIVARFDGGFFTTSGRYQTYVAPLDMDDHIDAYGRARLDVGDLSLQASLSHFNISGLIDMGLEFNGIEIGHLPYFDGRVDKITTQAQHTLGFYHNRLIYGAEYIYNMYSSSILVEPDQDEHRFGVFLQDEIDLQAMLRDLLDISPPALTLTAGLRLDVNSVTHLEVSPRAAMVYRLNESHSLRLGYAHAFRKPTFLETSMRVHLDGNLGFNELDVRAPDLENRHIDALDAGYTGCFLGGKLQVRLDAAYTWYRNMIHFDINWEEIEYRNIGGVLIPDINGPGIGFFNRKWGFNGHTLEMQINAKPVDWFRAFLNVAYRQVFDQKNGKFRGMEPVWLLASGVDLSHAAGFKFSVRGFFSDRYRRSIYSPEGLLEPMLSAWVPAYWFLSARLAWTLSKKPLDLEVGVEAFNLLNNRFREFVGIDSPNGVDYGGERFSRRITLFVRGEI